MSSDAKYREAIADFIREQARPEEKYGHQPRLYALASEIAAHLGTGAAECDDDVLYAAAWLHDLGVFIGHRPEDPVELERWDNVAYAMDHAPGILARVGFPAAKIPAVVEAIRTHQPSCQPTAVEGIILRDADILEQLGAVGIMRTVCKIGRDTRFPTFTAAVVSLCRALDTLPSRLLLEPAREMAQTRIQAMEQFLEAAAAEGGMNLS
jgi:uncharacterized protein